MEEKNKNKRKNIMFIVLSILLLIGIGSFIIFFLLGSKPISNKKDTAKNNNKKNKEVVIKEKVDIIDTNSKTRPIAVSINNTPVAIPGQTGLNNAYLIYEIPTEGYTSRLLAFYKDVPNTKVGTIRSARHNFIDFAYESDAVLVAYGWSHYAEDELTSNVINYVEGVVGEGRMYRDNPLGLAYEHTVYGETDAIKEYAYSTKGYNRESDNTILLNYNVSDTDLSTHDNKIIANKVTVNYGDVDTVFIYDNEKKMYNRNVNGVERKDMATGETFNTKNIIIHKISYQMCDDNHYWCLNTTGSGEGYYITNGYAVPIKWSKDSRNSKTKYSYINGEEISVSDGRTYIEVQIYQKDTIIE